MVQEGVLLRPQLRGTAYSMVDEARKYYINCGPSVKCKCRAPVFAKHLHSGSVRQQGWMKLQKWKIELKSVV